MIFNNVLGHDKPKEILYRAIIQKKVAHAYLFQGEPSLGKKYLALEFAKWINCEKGGKNWYETENSQREPSESCNRCSSCRLIQASSHPDIEMILPEGNTLKIQQIRNLQQRIFLKPHMGIRKVFIINDAEKLKREAANAFLKTLEEPPEDCTLILISSRPHLLLPTLVSRCQRISFSPFPLNFLEEILHTQKGFPLQEARAMAYVAMGRIGKALLLQTDLFQAEKGDTLNTLNTLIEEDISFLFKVAETWGRDNEVMEEKIFWISLWLRDLFFLHSGEKPILAETPEEVSLLTGFADHFSLEEFQLIHNQMIRALEGIRRNHNRQLSMEIILLSIREVLSSKRSMAYMETT